MRVNGVTQFWFTFIGLGLTRSAVEISAQDCLRGDGKRQRLWECLVEAIFRRIISPRYESDCPNLLVTRRFDAQDHQRNPLHS